MFKLLSVFLTRDKGEKALLHPHKFCTIFMSQYFCQCKIGKKKYFTYNREYIGQYVQQCKKGL